jgi:4-amino-4-deoxy-L-arabinose transferase-like glycosyltransferase
VYSSRVRFIEQPRQFTKHAYLIGSIFIVAAGLRLGFVTTAAYGPKDEIDRDFDVVWRLWHCHDFPLLGPPSILGGFSFGAAYYYLEALFVRLANFERWGAVLAIAFFSLLSFWALYFLCKLWFKDPLVAVIASGLQAIALFDIQNSYSPSNVSLLPFFVVSWFWLLTLICEGRQSAAKWLGLGIVSGIAVQLHATALVLLPIIFLWVLWRFRIVPAASHAFAFLIALVAANACYFLDFYLHGARVARALFGIGRNHLSHGNRGEILFGFVNFFGSFLVFKDGSYFNSFSRLAGLQVAGVFGLVLVTSAVGLWIRLRPRFVFDKVQPAGQSILWAWFMGGLSMYVVFAPPPSYYYFVIMWPMPAILVAYWLVALFRFSTRYFTVLAAAYVVLQLFCFAMFADYLNHTADTSSVVSAQCR